MLSSLTRVLPATAIAAAALFAAPMSANALQFKYDGPESGFVGASYTRLDEARTGSVSAGAFKITEMSGSTAIRNFVAWCFDLDTTIASGPTYDYAAKSDLLAADPPYFNPPGSTAQSRVQKLFDKSYTLDVLTSAAKSGAFQMAIWEVLYDTDFNITSGNFKVDSDTDVNALAQGYLDGVATSTLPQKWVLTTYDSGGAQDLGEVAPIPLPAAVWLLLGVSGALVASKRRSARQAV